MRPDAPRPASTGVALAAARVTQAGRLDNAMVAAGLSRSRAQAREAILRGAVAVDGKTAARPGMRVAPGTEMLAEALPYVSRSGHKLAAALAHYRMDVTGARALDVGASTGGFTDVLLRHGAREVVALDVGHGQLAQSIAADPRVTAMEGVNARELDRATLRYAPNVVVVDVSFISLCLVLPNVLGVAAPRAEVVALVKPQFEVGREHVGKGGIVRDEGATAAALGRVVKVIEDAGFEARAAMPSPIAGADGNKEWLIAAARS